MLTTGDIAARLCAELIGRSDLPIERVDALDAADVRTLSFIRSAKFAGRWATSSAGAAMVARGVDVPGHDPARRALLVVAEPDVALTAALELLVTPEPAPAAGVHPSAVIDPSARVDAGAHVGPMCVLGAGAVIEAGAALLGHVSLGAGVRVGANSILHPHVAIYARCVIGARVIIHGGAVIGADGFGYRPGPSGLIKLPHLGNAVIGDDVEIGANACIDRARFGSTTIGAGTKLDNLVQIGHNCRIGRHCVICGCCAIGGSVTIGDGTQMGGACAVADNVVIGAGVRIAGTTVVMSDLADGITVAGYPAMPGREYLRVVAAMRAAAGLPSLSTRGERAEPKSSTEHGEPA
ncbi:UDP-3-O-(3-hydroxymyristoyl)glucosamine N-acyltransferase [soil metagenome]